MQGQGCIWPGHKHKSFNKWYSYFMLIWCFFIIFSYLMRFAFENGKPEIYVIYMDICLAIFYFIDIIRIFTSPFQVDNKWVYNRKRIAKNYLTGWFFLDIYAFFPLAYLRYRSRREDGSLNE